MNFQITELEKDKYEVWNRFCQENDEAGFLHTTDWLEYSVSCRPEVNSKSLSFLVSDDRGALAVCPLVMEELNRNGQVSKTFSNSGGDGYIVVPALKNGLTEKRKANLLKFILSHIDKIAVENGVKKACFRFTPVVKAGPSYNFLMKFGFLDTSANTQIIDPSLPEEKLAQDVRKGHKYDIKRGEKAYVVEIYDRTNITKEIFEQYRLLHRKAAGRVTRPATTFEMMYRWILNGKAILCGAKYGGKGYIGFSLITMFKDEAYYSSYSDDPEAEVTAPVAHVLQWKIIKWLRENGIRAYDIGAQRFSSQIGDYPSRKDLDISFFKRGFGGKTVTLYRGVKYYDNEHMRQDLENSIGKTVQNLKNLAKKQEDRIVSF